MFDHAWNKNEVAAQIKKLSENCLLMHCYCHTLNLAVRDAIKNIPLQDIPYKITKLSAIVKNYGILIKLWGWERDNVSNSDMKARIIGVQTKMQTFSFFYGLQLVIVVLSQSDKLSSSSLQRAELRAVHAKNECQAFCHCSSRSIRQGCKPPLDQGHWSCFEAGVNNTFTSTSP